MLTFYPEFEVDNITDNEIILLLDLSNSMKVCAHFCLPLHLLTKTFTHQEFSGSCYALVVLICVCILFKLVIALYRQRFQYFILMLILTWTDIACREML